MAVTWERVYRKNKNEIRSKKHVLMVYTHYVCIRKGFRCVGIGQTSTGPLSDNDKLPRGWNKSFICKLRYEYRNLTHILMFIIEGRDKIIVKGYIPLLEEEGYEVLFSLRDFCERRGPLRRMIPHYRRIFWYLNNEFLAGFTEMTYSQPNFKGFVPFSGPFF